TPTKTITTKTRLLGVCGWPVEHSLSPAIQNAAIHAARADYVYLAFPIKPDAFQTAVRGLAAAGMIGLNCTIPHKDAALALSDEITEEAQMVNAVNTLTFRDGKIFGANTDIEGYVETLKQDGRFNFQDARVCQLGCGGAGRAMAFGTLIAGAASLTLVNRTTEKAEALAQELKRRYPHRTIKTLSFDNTEALRENVATASLVANATSLGLHEGDAFPCPVEAIPADALVFDAAYTAERSTAWLRAAANRGNATLDGLGMLVRQGAASFRIWTGIEADISAMFDALPKGP
ncbi:MAG: shikimate dehydrogenase, partial [Candidatus Sumerlaeia bacterium]